MLNHATLSKCLFNRKKQVGQHLFCFNVSKTIKAPTFDNILSCTDKSQQDFDHLDSSDPPDFYRGCGEKGLRSSLSHNNVFTPTPSPLALNG